MFYIAAPVNARRLDYYMQRSVRIAQKLEEAGIKIYFPQRDTKQNQSAKRIYERNIAALKRARALILVMSNSRGIYLEAGYAKAHKKPIIGLRVTETTEMGPIIRNFMDYFVNSPDDLAKLLKKFSKKRTTKKTGVKTIRTKAKKKK